jgi:hypothetical protein
MRLRRMCNNNGSRITTLSRSWTGRRLVTVRRSERKGIQVIQVARLKAHFLAHRKILSKEF